MMKKVEAAFLISITLSAAFLMSTPPAVAGQSWPVLKERGLNYEIWQKNQTHFAWISAPPWVWNGSKYVPYIFEDHYGEAGYYLMRNAYITVRLYSDHAEFWDVNYTEIRVHEERWLTQYYDGEWHTIDKYKPSFRVVTNSSGIFITQSWTLGKPINSEETFTTTYALREARPLEHFMTLKNKGTDSYEFRLVQAWDGIAATTVKHSEGVTKVTSPINVYSLWFQFVSDTSGFVVFEDLRSTGYYDERYTYHNDVLQQATISPSPRGLTVSFTYSNRSLYTLGPGESLLLDPDTWTGHNEYDLSGYLQRDGYIWPPSYTTAHPGGSILAGKEKVSWREDPLYMDHYYVWRGYVSFDTSGVNDNWNVQSVTLRMFLIYSQCEGEEGLIGVGFSVEFYSGKNQWTELTADKWDACPTYEGEFLWIEPEGMERKYYGDPGNVDPSSIQRGTGRTQFRFNLYADTNPWWPPEGNRAVQKVWFDNPLGNGHREQDAELIIEYTL